MSLNRDDYIILPKTISFQDTESAISYESGNENQAAVITYSYHGVDIGTVKVDFNVNKEEGYVFDVLPEEEEKEEPVIFVNVAAILIGVSALAVILFIVLLARVILRNYSIQGRSRRRRRRRQQRARRRRRAGRRGRDHLDFF